MKDVLKHTLLWTVVYAAVLGAALVVARDMPEDRCSPPIARVDAPACEKIFADRENGVR